MSKLHFISKLLERGCCVLIFLKACRSMTSNALFWAMMTIAMVMTADAVAETSKSYAVVVGVDVYSGTEFKNLKHAVVGARAVAELLEARNFDVRLLLDREATRDRIWSEMDAVSAKLKEEDRVFFYFAGHGETRLRGTKDFGYLVPFGGARLSDRIAIRDLQSWTEQMDLARHQLFILDACYGGHFGSFLRGRPPGFTQQPQNLRVFQARKARQFITAGGKNQRVSDRGPNGHSVFTGQFLRALREGKGDVDGDGFVTFAELSRFLESTASTSFQTPYSGTFLGDEGGSFLFTVKPGTPLPAPIVHNYSPGAPRSTHPNRSSPPPRTLRVREGAPSEDSLLGISVSALFGSLGDVPYVTVMVQTPDGRSSRQACYDGGTKLAFSIGDRVFRGLLTSIDWQAKEVSLSLSEVFTPEEEDAPRAVPGQRIKYLQIVLDGFEILDSSVRVSLKARNTSGDRGLGLAWFAKNSGGIADFWKFFPSVNAYATDDRGNTYLYESSDGLGFATTKEDWLIVKAGEEASFTVELRLARGAPGKVFSFSAPIRLAWRDDGKTRSETGMFNIRLTDIQPTGRP